MRKHFYAACSAALILCSFGQSASAGDVEGAKKFVDGVASQVITIVKDGSGKEAQQNKLLGVVDQNVDIDFVAKFVLGKHWRTATEAQRKEYLAAYRPFLKKNYVSKLTRYSGQTYTMGTAHEDSDGSYIVNMKINDPNGTPIVMVYRVVDASGNYRISDIVVEGVSLLGTQRSEFGAVAQSKGVDGLIAALKKKVAS